MVDTIRTLPELLALFADNSSGDIDAQAGRDLIVSISSMPMTTAVELTIAGGVLDLDDAGGAEHIIVRSETPGAPDILETLTGPPNKLFLLRISGTAESITFSDDDNIHLPDGYGPNFVTVTGQHQYALVWFHPELTHWLCTFPLHAHSTLKDPGVGEGQFHVEGTSAFVNGVLVFTSSPVTIAADKITDVVTSVLTIDTEGGGGV